jgi:transcriptional regulator
MYMPAHHTRTERDLAIAVIRENPFAILVSNGADDEPFATHAPLVLDERGDRLVLIGHIARANPHTQLFGLVPRVLAIFSGPNGYVSPSNYTVKEAVPTWNYVAVHVYGDVRIVEGHAAKDRSQKRLIGDHDPDYDAQWRSLDPAYQTRMLDGITVLEIDIVRFEAKFKLSQNRGAEDRARVKARHAAGTPGERALAAWMERLQIG